MKRRRYATLDEIKTASKEELKKILKNDFLKCFEDWKNRWHKCIISHGDYFEGDKIASRPFSCLCLEHTQSLHPLLTPTQQPYSRIMSSQKRKRESITIEKKKEICQLARNNPTISKNEIGERFSLPRTSVSDILTQAENMLANSGYDPANIYNADETGLLLIIGKSAKPRCFRNFSPHFYCTYTTNSKAWMTSSIFQEWLLQFNKQLVSEGRRILLLLDNATSHCVPNDGLSNIKIHFLPPNMTASLQPLDIGIIKSFKAQYRKLHLQKMVELADAHLPTELRLDYAVRYCKMAWDSVSPDSISNCWNHTGIRFTSTAVVEPLNYGNLLDRIRDIFAFTPDNLITEREFQLVDDSQEAEMKLTDDNLLVSTVTAKEELGEDDDATVTKRLPSLREARTASETILLYLEHSKRATSDDVNLSADLLRRVYAISEGEKRQVVITDFFKKISNYYRPSKDLVKITAKIVKSDGSAITENDEITVNNNIINIFKIAKSLYNNKEEEDIREAGLTSLVRFLIDRNPDYIRTNASLSMLYLDTADSLDKEEFTYEESGTAPNISRKIKRNVNFNKGYTDRWIQIKAGKELNAYIKLCDLFCNFRDNDKVRIGFEHELQLTRNDDSNILIGNDTNYKFIIENIEWWIRKVTPSLNIRADLALKLKDEVNMKYETMNVNISYNKTLGEEDVKIASTAIRQSMVFVIFQKAERKEILKIII
ncbi:hypothetical protein LAZ67_17001909 [Cordylochernes scorpioides]|uniref:DDE-1 domain-containing protein n=1 Tax=Cordylochernes scorpioides TaxID=51811 RepID=A0ABY6LDQ0_9ARAC|nr:hypothetical protein LAZ67_17001909 [Cordylochernes scorpioides]